MKSKEEFKTANDKSIELSDKELDNIVGGINVGGYEYVDANGIKRKTSSLAPRIVEVD